MRCDRMRRVSNPLLEYQGLPAYSDIRPEHVAPAVRRVLAENRAALDAVLKSASDGDTLVISRRKVVAFTSPVGAHR